MHANLPSIVFSRRYHDLLLHRERPIDLRPKVLRPRLEYYEDCSEEMDDGEDKDEDGLVPKVVHYAGSLLHCRAARAEGGKAGRRTWVKVGKTMDSVGFLTC